MFLLVNEQELSELMELSYTCSMSSLKNRETWFDKEKWFAGLEQLFGKEVLNKVKGAPVEVKVFLSPVTPETRVCEKVPPDPVAERLVQYQRMLRLYEPGDFLRELNRVWP